MVHKLGNPTTTYAAASAFGRILRADGQIVKLKAEIVNKCKDNPKKGCFNNLFKNGKSKARCIYWSP
ncbi:hypothetical protein NPIL_456121 [Nephila pilipes]|uniref:Uncharacterized protein n=1 Tax=Nephila pilipes TaxID=299642 RepID=A0A8X6QKZ3_NEPPI|nr:hypothetical protein NPIL_456121 [Nephila pilipes]